MITLASLWLPVVLSAVFVFFASFLLHTVLPWHKGDWKKLAAEDEVMEALRRFSLPPGDYMLPCGGGAEAMKDPKFLEKLKRGPVLLMTVLKSGRMDMGPSLAQWFVYCLVISVIAGYVASRALEPGSHYLAVFRFAGVTAFAAYALAQWQESIWHKRSWGTTMRNNIDGLLYGLVTAGTFGWLWPK
jgi:hypothetical protein